MEGELILKYTRTQIGGGFFSESSDGIQGNAKGWEQWAQQDGSPLGEGYIGIQAHDPMEFRNIELLDISR